MKNVNNGQIGQDQKGFKNETKDGYKLFEFVSPVTIKHDGKEYTIYEICTDSFTNITGNIYGGCKMMSKDGISCGCDENGYLRTRMLEDFRYVYKANNIIETQSICVKFNKQIKRSVSNGADYTILTYLIPEEAKVIDRVIIEESIIDTERYKDNLSSHLKKLENEDLNEIIEYVNMTHFGTFATPLKGEEFYVGDHGTITYLNGRIHLLYMAFSIPTLTSLVEKEPRLRKLIDWETAKITHTREYDIVKHDRMLTGSFLSALFKDDFNGLLDFIEGQLNQLVLTNDIVELNNLSENDLRNSYFINYIDENFEDKYMIIKNYRRIWQVQRIITAKLYGKILFQGHVRDHEEFDKLCSRKAQTRVHSVTIEKVSIDNKSEIYELDLDNEDKPFIVLYKHIAKQNYTDVNSNIAVSIDVTINEKDSIKRYKNYRLPIIYDLKQERFMLKLTLTDDNAIYKHIWR